MNKYEKELFFELCDHTSTNTDKLSKLLPDNATPEVLGHLFFNRVQGIAYGILNKNGLLSSVNREFRNSLKSAYTQNSEKNRSYFKCLRILSEILTAHSGKFAMLKGAVLCKLYPEGYRTSNDIDLLVDPKHITDIGETLINAGFSQGNIRDGEFVAATRREIIESKIMRGETVPYIFKIDLPYMEYLEVDINFSLDYKNCEDTVVESMLSRSTELDLGDFSVTTLDRWDFLVHLCCHLYKEATTLPWIKMNRDMTVYKFCDIRLVTNSMTNTDCRDFFARASEIGMAKICACAILWTDGLLGIGNRYLTSLAWEFLKDETFMLYTVISPAEKKSYTYIEKDIRERFFTKDRTTLLKEVT